MPRITEVVSGTDDLRTLSEALIVSGIDETLAENGPYTLFAPNEGAFSEIGADALVALAADCEDLAYTLRSHVVSGSLKLSDLVDLERLVTIEGTELLVSRGEDGEAYVEKARIVRGDIETDNGVVHIIDLVVLPVSGKPVVVDEVAGLVHGNVLGISDEHDSYPVFDYEVKTSFDDSDDSVAV